MNTYHLRDPALSLSDDSEKPEKASPQSGPGYAILKKKLLENQQLFEDPDFSAVDSSLFYSQSPPWPVVWKRPSEMVDAPKFMVNDASRFDIRQGVLGNCWMLSSLAGLSQHKALLNHVVPFQQSFDEEYCGMFRFRFWQYGEWKEVVIDDRLPTAHDQIIFLRSSESNEFWTPLLEKAYAKLYGSYEALSGGDSCESMEDFTGGLAETFDLADVNEDFFKTLKRHKNQQSLMCCCILGDAGEKLDNGLMKYHSYTVTGAREITWQGKEVSLVRVRNPWGRREWNGAWSDTSEEWLSLNEETKKEMELVCNDDGEFWMSFPDFSSNFSRVSICLLSPDAAGDTPGKSWVARRTHGRWQRNVTSGGCRNFPETFYINPQYRIKLDKSDDGADTCSLVISLMQKGAREQRCKQRNSLSIGFAVYKLNNETEEYEEDGRMNKDFFLYNASEEQTSFTNRRSIIFRLALPPGLYCVVPSSFAVGEEGDFVLRMFAENAHGCEAMDTRTRIDQTVRNDETDVNSVCGPSEEVDQSEKSDESKEKVAVGNDALDKMLKPAFEHVRGSDGSVNAYELQLVANAAFKEALNGKEFSLETCRSIVAVSDTDRNGELDYQEFRRLFATLMKWINFFKKSAGDDAELNALEMRNALAQLGLHLSTNIVSSILLRYASRSGGIGLDDFVQICCRLNSTFRSFKAFRGEALKLDDYIMSAIYT